MGKTSTVRRGMSSRLIYFIASRLARFVFPLSSTTIRTSTPRFFAFASACITSGSVKEYAIILMELSALLIVSSTRADALPSGEKPTFTDGVSIIANDGVVNSNGHASSDTRSRVTIVFLPDIKTPEFNRGQSSLVVIPYGGDTTMGDRRRWPLSEC